MNLDADIRTYYPCVVALLGYDDRGTPKFSLYIDERSKKILEEEHLKEDLPSIGRILEELGDELPITSDIT